MLSTIRGEDLFRVPLTERMNSIAANMSATPLAAASTTAKPRKAVVIPAKPKTPAAAGAKRTHADITPDESPIEISDDDPRLQSITDNADQIRRKIRTFLNSGVMKVGEFQQAVNTNSTSYGRFMKQSGPDAGTGSNIYQEAWAFFKKRELAGTAMPKKKVKKAQETSKYDVETVILDNEATDEVKVYDTCDDVRRKITVHLREESVTQAGFLKACAKCFKTKARKIQGKQLADFLGKDGPTSGNMSSVYYGAYCLFEKMRIKEGKEKSKKRVEMEKIWQNGMDIKRSSAHGFFCHNDERPVEDAYGRLNFVKIR